VARGSFTSAVLLKAVDYGEADRIVTLLTEAHGKISAMARGARKSKRRFAGGLTSCALIEVEIALGRGELGRLSQARLVQGYPGILADLKKMQAAFAGLSWVREGSPFLEPAPLLLRAVLRYFAALDEADKEGVEGLSLAFRARALALLGSSPGLSRCGRSGEPAPEGSAALFDPLLGSIVSRAAGGGSILLSGATRAALLQAAEEGWPEAAPALEGKAAAQAEALLSAFAAHHIDPRLASRSSSSRPGGSPGRPGGRDKRER
jgi:DNA repair protein RecO (recombination protein O)